MSNAVIRFVNSNDAARLAEIYSYFVNNTAISFEYIAPDKAEFENRIASIFPHYPFIVYEIDNKVVGYAYGHRYLERAAYRWDAELSIYIDKDYHGQKIGKALYGAVIDLLRAMNFQTVYGIVTSPNPKSEHLHNSMGFRNSGVMKKSGYKLGKWYDITNFELAIGEYPDTPSEPVSALQIPEEVVSEIFKKYSI